MKDTQIDPRAADAHAWLSGYSRGLTGGDHDQRFTDLLLQNAYLRGWEHGREVSGR